MPDATGISANEVVAAVHRDSTPHVQELPCQRPDRLRTLGWLDAWTHRVKRLVLRHFSVLRLPSTRRSIFATRFVGHEAMPFGQSQPPIFVYRKADGRCVSQALPQELSRSPATASSRAWVTEWSAKRPSWRSSSWRSARPAPLAGVIGSSPLR
jgi:hypothetical protein